MKVIMIIILLVHNVWGQNKSPFQVDIRPRVINNAKVLINVEIINNVGRPLDYLEGFLSEFSEDELIDEKRMVLLYSYEPPLQTGYSTTKTAKLGLRSDYLSTYKFSISKIKFVGDNRVFSWHQNAGFIRID